MRASSSEEGSLVHVGVGDEQRALVDHQAVERGQCRFARAQADDVADVLQVRIEAALQAAEHAVRIAQRAPSVRRWWWSSDAPRPWPPPGSRRADP